MIDIKYIALNSEYDIGIISNNFYYYRDGSLTILSRCLRQVDRSVPQYIQYLRNYLTFLYQYHLGSIISIKLPHPYHL